MASQPTFFIQPGDAVKVVSPGFLGCRTLTRELIGIVEKPVEAHELRENSTHFDWWVRVPVGLGEYPFATCELELVQ